MTTFPDGLVIDGKRYRQEAPRFRFAWDDELIDYGFKCRTQQPQDDPINVDNPPAVLRFAPSIQKTIDEAGRPVVKSDWRVNLEKEPSWRWRDAFIAINSGDVRKYEYLIGSNRAQFNTTGWPKMAYLAMCGNEVNVLERRGGWVKFETLRASQWQRAMTMKRATHPTLIHTFTCVTWNRETQTTKRIFSTGTPRGIVDYPCVTWEGYGWIPERFIVPL